MALALNNPRGWYVIKLKKNKLKNIVVNEFELQLRYYIHFWTNTLGKGRNPLILSGKG